MDNQNKVEIQVNENGSLLVKGQIHLKDAKGNELKTTEYTYLCRCGHSSNKPFCDGKHKSTGFEG